VHEVEPEEAVNVPAGQLRHALVTVFQYAPAGQGPHEDERENEYVFASQSVQDPALLPE